MNGILDKVNTPADIKKLSVGELELLAEDVRSLIIDTVSKTGGHLAASLGVVDLTIAMLKTFDPPEDKLVWDVSHQSYAYKILTDRKNRFSTLRQFDGISGFTRRSESEYDSFGAGHSGTAISATLGMAVARDMRKSDEHVVAVLGDGAAGCGISFEALNNVHGATERLIVVLNDNEMSIAANVGAMSRYLGGLLANPRYNRWKHSVESVAAKLGMGWLRSFYYKLEESVKGLFLRSVIFEEFGLRYVGPVDGHNMHALLDALSIARDYDRPIIIHVSTKKGKGYPPAEQHPEKWHGTPPFDVSTGDPKKQQQLTTYSHIFGSTLCRLAKEDEKLVAITAAMQAGTGLSEYARSFPERFFDVGISEEHAAVFAAGMATEGYVPFLALYSTFAQRTVDYIIHDICLQDLPVVLCLDRSGIVGDDGPTHHGTFDISLLRSIPGLTIMQPADEKEMANMLYTSSKLGRPVVIRYPRGSGSGQKMPEKFEELEIGAAKVVRQSADADIQIWALGDMVSVAESVAGLLSKDNITCGVVNARFVKPLDKELIINHAKECKTIVTIENAVLQGGFGSAVSELLCSEGIKNRVLKFGWPDEFIPHGSMEQLFEKYGLTADNIAKSIRSQQ